MWCIPCPYRELYSGQEHSTSTEFHGAPTGAPTGLSLRSGFHLAYAGTYQAGWSDFQVQHISPLRRTRGAGPAGEKEVTPQCRRIKVKGREWEAEAPSVLGHIALHTFSVFVNCGHRL